MTDKLIFGKVPVFGYVDRQFKTANKPAGNGWDDLGKRTPLFIVLHRMVGTLTGTDNFFPTAPALTDYGIGTANVDGKALDGVIYQWNDPRGRRAGWASGPVNQPYGDGLAWLNWSGNKWGASICNVAGVSIENSGNYNDPMTDFAFGELAKFCAYWFDQFKVPYDKAPIRPDTGISAITWHQEWTIGTGKICPGPWLMDRTQALIDAAAAIMKPYQTGAQTTPEPQPEPDYVPLTPAVATVAGAVGRDAQSRDGKVTTTYKAGDTVRLIGYFHGQAVGGDDRWYVIDDDARTRIHASGLVNPPKG